MGRNSSKGLEVMCSCWSNIVSSCVHSRSHVSGLGESEHCDDLWSPGSPRNDVLMSVVGMWRLGTVETYISEAVALSVCFCGRDPCDPCDPCVTFLDCVSVTSWARPYVCRDLLWRAFLGIRCRYFSVNVSCWTKPHPRTGSGCSQSLVWMFLSVNVFTSWGALWDFRRIYA